MNNIVGVYDDRLVLDNPIVPRDPAIKQGSTCELFVGEDESGVNKVPRTCISNGDGTFYEIGGPDSKLANAICGEVYAGYELSISRGGTHMVRGGRIVIKAMDKFTIRHLQRIGNKENPLREISIMQILGANTPHVSGLIDAVEDDTKVYAIMKYLGTELFNFAGKISEKKIQHCFRQIVKGVRTLQRNSFCHRDISLENILVSSSGTCTIIDFGLTLIVPRMQQKVINSVVKSCNENACGKSRQRPTQCDEDERTDDEEDSTDLSAMAEFMEDDEAKDTLSGMGGEEYVPVMLLPQGICGKENYVAPEILANSDPFDGMLVDNWALGVLLFMLFTGRPPFLRADSSDEYFRWIQKHRLREVLNNWGVADDVSPAATDLLERMLKSTDPRRRLTCDDILSHPWMNQAL